MEETPTSPRGAELRRVGGGSAFGAVVAAATGSTPIGVVVVAGLAGALTWRLARERHGS